MHHPRRRGGLVERGDIEEVTSHGERRETKRFGRLAMALEAF